MKLQLMMTSHGIKIRQGCFVLRISYISTLFVRVCCSVKNDIPDSNSMQKHGAFYSAENQHAGVPGMSGFD